MAARERAQKLRGGARSGDPRACARVVRWAVFGKPRMCCGGQEELSTQVWGERTEECRRVLPTQVGGESRVWEGVPCARMRLMAGSPLRPMPRPVYTHVSIEWIWCCILSGCPSSPMPFLKLSTRMSCCSIAFDTTRLLGS
eukprot:365316-Chlamydomonas_euryale.AAC.4